VAVVPAPAPVIVVPAPVVVRRPPVVIGERRVMYRDHLPPGLAKKCYGYEHVHWKHQHHDELQNAGGASVEGQRSPSTAVLYFDVLSLLKVPGSRACLRKSL
jgi:hypothetical protein